MSPGRGVVLTVAINCDDDFAAGMIEPGHQSCGLAEVATKHDELHAIIRHRLAFDEFGRSVRASVINDNDLEFFVQRLQVDL